MKKLLVLGIILFLSGSVAFANEITANQMKKLEKIESKKISELHSAYTKIERLRWDKNISHDVLSAYTQKTLSKINKKYESRISKVLDANQRQAYETYLASLH